MKKIIAGLAILASAPLLGLGIAAMFLPRSMFGLFDLTPMGTFGLNTVRADLGGMLIASAAMIYIGLLKKQATWFLATILLMGTLLVGRIISFIADGWTVAAIPAVVVEVFVIGVLLIASRKLPEAR